MSDLLLEQSAAAARIAACRQVRVRQRGVQLGYRQSFNYAPYTRFVSAPIPVGSGDFTLEYYGTAYGSNDEAHPVLANAAGSNYGPGHLVVNNTVNESLKNYNGLTNVWFERDAGGSIQTDRLIMNYIAPSWTERIHFVLTRSGRTVKAYIGGALRTAKEQSAVKDFGALRLTVMNSSDACFLRVYGAALTAAEVSALWNGGAPASRLLPAAARARCLAEYLPQNLVLSKRGPEVEPAADAFEFHLGSPYSVPAIPTRQYPFDCVYRVDYAVEAWDYRPKSYNTVGFLGVNGASIPLGAAQWYSESAAKVGEVQSVFVRMPGTGSPGLYLYGGTDNEAAAARHLKVAIKGIAPVSFAAEWLDSARQMPYNDAYLPPLLESIGGRDMAADGAPQIIYAN